MNMHSVYGFPKKYYLSSPFLRKKYFENAFRISDGGAVYSLTDKGTDYFVRLRINGRTAEAFIRSLNFPYLTILITSNKQKLKMLTS